MEPAQYINGIVTKNTVECELTTYSLEFYDPIHPLINGGGVEEVPNGVERTDSDSITQPPMIQTLKGGLSATALSQTPHVGNDGAETNAAGSPLYVFEGRAEISMGKRRLAHADMAARIPQGEEEVDPTVYACHILTSLGAHTNADHYDQEELIPYVTQRLGPDGKYVWMLQRRTYRGANTMQGSTMAQQNISPTGAINPEENEDEVLAPDSAIENMESQSWGAADNVGEAGTLDASGPLPCNNTRKVEEPEVNIRAQAELAPPPNILPQDFTSGARGYGDSTVPTGERGPEVFGSLSDMNTPTLPQDFTGGVGEPQNNHTQIQNAAPSSSNSPQDLTSGLRYPENGAVPAPPSSQERENETIRFPPDSAGVRQHENIRMQNGVAPPFTTGHSPRSGGDFQTRHDTSAMSPSAMTELLDPFRNMLATFSHELQNLGQSVASLRQEMHMSGGRSDTGFNRSNGGSGHNYDDGYDDDNDDNDRNFNGNDEGFDGDESDVEMQDYTRDFSRMR
ncbi:hypothetical protein NM688_g9254 [Phlebia brevispora]|uniref:Uncharacterized protein n=1 Tax=Phlebia brevispora TaxID=194682 RepID=A0ACC1RIX7_9APHY|nr:hypothetical protein NM688_g9254 [Phlebia brevispora]